MCGTKVGPPYKKRRLCSAGFGKYSEISRKSWKNTKAISSSYQFGYTWSKHSVVQPRVKNKLDLFLKTFLAKNSRFKFLAKLLKKNIDCQSKFVFLNNNFDIKIASFFRNTILILAPISISDRDLIQNWKLILFLGLISIFDQNYQFFIMSTVPSHNCYVLWFFVKFFKKYD